MLCSWQRTKTPESSRGYGGIAGIAHRGRVSNVSNEFQANILDHLANRGPHTAEEGERVQPQLNRTTVSIWI